MKHQREGCPLDDGLFAPFFGATSGFMAVTSLVLPVPPGAMALGSHITLLHAQTQPRHTNECHVPLPQVLRKTPGHHPEHPGGCPVLLLLLQFPRCWQHSLHSPHSSLELTGGKVRHVGLPSLKACSCPNLAKSLTSRLFLPSVSDPDLGGKIAITQKCHFSASLPYAHHKSLPAESLSQFLNWFQKEHTLDARWLHLNGSFAKVILKHADDDTQLLWTFLPGFPSTCRITFHLLLKLAQ